MFSSPAVADGKVYFGSQNSTLFCLNSSTGIKIWSHPFYNNPIQSSPSVFGNKVYIALSNTLFCLNASTGTVKWIGNVDGVDISSPAITDDKVFIGSYYTHKIYCLNATTGARVWTYTTGNSVYSSPAVANGIVYVGSYDGKVYAFGSAIIPEFPTITITTMLLTILAIPIVLIKRKKASKG
jgi:outer membrane protein assembly factor BamB